MTGDSSSARMSCLPDDCISTCENAHSILTDIVDRVCSGEVTFVELEKICKRQEHVKSLCAAASYSQREMDVGSLEAAIHKRMSEFEVLCKYWEQLDTFCRYIRVSVTGKLFLIQIQPMLLNA